MNATPIPRQSSTDPADTEHLRVGRRITLDEIAVHVSSAAVLLDQVAYAAETPNAPIELADLIDDLRRTAEHLHTEAATALRLHFAVIGDLPLAARFQDGRGWGAAAQAEAEAESDKPAAHRHPPAIIPTYRQLQLLADRGKPVPENHPLARWTRVETTTFPEAMAGIHFVESKTARARREAERTEAIQQEITAISCTSPKCSAEVGEPCRTSTGRATEQPHAARLTEATARVDARLDALDTATGSRYV